MDRLTLSMIFASCLSMNALAQVTAESCTKLANVIARQETTQLSDRLFEAMRYYALCDASQSASDSALNIGYAGFTLGGSYREQKSKQSCGQSYQQSNIRTVDYINAKTVFDKALSTINQCLAYAAKGWDVNFEPHTQDSASILISNHSGTGGSLLGAEIIANDKLECNPALPSSALTITSTTPFSTTCKRTPSKQIYNGVELTSTQDAAIVLRTAEGTFALRMPGYSSSVLKQLEERIDAAKVDVMRETIKGISLNYEDLSIAPASGVVEKPISCKESTGLAISGGIQALPGNPVSIRIHQSFQSAINSWTVKASNEAGRERGVGKVRVFTVCLQR